MQSSPSRAKCDEVPSVDASGLITPCLVVFPDRVRHNVGEAIRVAGDVNRLRPHVKTHKMREIVQLESDAGISKHKCATLAEAEMLAECAAEDILIAYPQVGPATKYLCGLQSRFPNTVFRTTIDDASSISKLAAAAVDHGVKISVLADLDIGMHRTGVLETDRAVQLVELVEQSEALSFGGFHAYDGHNHMADQDARLAAVTDIAASLSALVQRLTRNGTNVPRIVCGGTPTFPMFASLSSIEGTPVELSPGTCILHDHRYQSHFPDIGDFQYAAVLLTRVISKPAPGQFTCDLGHKAVAADPAAGERCCFVDLPDAQEAGHNEEHLVVRSERAEELNVGDVLRVVPTHVCPTTALHEVVHVVENGQVVATWKVAARHRIYTA